MALLALTALVFAACGGDDGGGGGGPASGSWDDVVAAAEKEGKVTIYSGQGTSQLETLAEGFEKKYPKIQVEVVRGVESDYLPKLEAEARTGKGIADVAVITSEAWLTANADKAYAPRGPAFDAAEYDKAENIVDGGKTFTIDATVLTFAWNTERYDGKLTDYDDLLDPSLADGKIGVPPASFATFVDFWLYLEERFGPEFVEKLAAQNPRVYPSALPMAESLSSGEIAAATFVEPQVDEQEAGAPVDWGLATPAWGARFFGQLVQSAPHPNAAQVLADYMVTAEGQEAIARKAASVLPDIPGTVAEIKDVRKPADLDAEKVEEYQAKWDKLFQQS